MHAVRQKSSPEKTMVSHPDSYVRRTPCTKTQVAYQALEKVEPVTHAVGNVGKRIFVIGFSILAFGAPPCSSSSLPAPPMTHPRTSECLNTTAADDGS